MQALLKEFRTFLVRGNLVDLAVAFVIGVAFGALVNALVADLITPIIAAIAGGATRQSEIANRAGIGSNAVPPYLAQLMRLHVVENLRHH